jgi:hypothetical protein
MSLAETVHDDLRKAGYSQEEEYFYKANRELIDKLRETQNTTRKEQAETRQKDLHWRKCPECGHEMHDVPMNTGVRLEECGHCHGVFFSDKELDKLRRISEQGRFTHVLKQLFEPKDIEPHMF